ncbi:MAG: AMP phosphorylase, partial [Desulfurococcaceae archaeon]
MGSFVGLTPKRAFKVKSIDMEFPQPVVILNEDDAKELGIVPGNIVLVTVGDTHRSVIAMTTRTMAQRGECVFPLELTKKLGISNGDVIGLRLLGLPPSFNALKKRLKGEKLSEGEFLALLKDIVAGVYGEAEIAAFLVSQIYNPLTDSELAYLIKAMVETGAKVKFEETVYDIHSVGGVPGNSKVALLSVPIVASAGLLIPKTSSRAITSPAGT